MKPRELLNKPGPACKFCAGPTEFRSLGKLTAKDPYARCVGDCGRSQYPLRASHWIEQGGPDAE